VPLRLKQCYLVHATRCETVGRCAGRIQSDIVCGRLVDPSKIGGQYAIDKGPNVVVAREREHLSTLIGERISQLTGEGEVIAAVHRRAVVRGTLIGPLAAPWGCIVRIGSKYVGLTVGGGWSCPSTVRDSLPPEAGERKEAGTAENVSGGTCLLVQG